MKVEAKFQVPSALSSLQHVDVIVLGNSIKVKLADLSDEDYQTYLQTIIASLNSSRQRAQISTGIVYRGVDTTRFTTSEADANNAAELFKKAFRKV